MDIKFENHTQYDKAALLEANRVVSRTSRKTAFRLRRTFLLVLGILGLISGFFLLLIFEELETSEKILAVGAFIIGVIAILEGIFLRRIAAWNSKRFLMKGRTDHNFSFSEEEISAEIPGVERSSYPYSAFSAAYETKDYFFLLMDKRTIMIVDKSGFSAGNPENFRAFLAEKLQKEIPIL